MEKLIVGLALSVPFTLIGFMVINFLCVLYTFTWLMFK